MPSRLASDPKARLLNLVEKGICHHELAAWIGTIESRSLGRISVRYPTKLLVPADELSMHSSDAGHC